MREFDVAIIGCGPTGAMLGNLLGQAGLHVVVLEKEAGPTNLPRAIHFDGEVMRIFQSVGLAEAMSAISRPAVAGTKFMTPSGQTLMFRPGFEEAGPHGWPVNSYVHQPKLEAVLRAGLARFPNVELLTSHEVTGVEPNGEDTLLHAKDLNGHTGWSAKAKYIVGCDGARSLVRKQIGSDMEDLGLHQPWLVVDVLVNRESERARAMPEYSIQFCDPSRPMSVIYVEGNRRRWEIMTMPGDDLARLADPDRFWPMISRWIGPEDATVERSAVYTFHALIASPWRRGPLLLAGDACHQTPPFLGQGMCAGMRDAANLAWKLATVVKGEADQSLLDTYEKERSPHVAAFIKLAVELGAVIQTTDPKVAAERDARMAAGEPVIIKIPDPPLGPGMWAPSGSEAGKIFPQPHLADGRLLDEVCAGCFTVIADKKALNALDANTRSIWRALNIVVVPAESHELFDALANRDAVAIILRPDRYIFGIAHDADELSDLWKKLSKIMHVLNDRAA